MKQALLNLVKEKTTTVDDRIKPVYQSVVDNMSKEDAAELCNHCGIKTVQEAQHFAKNVKIAWCYGDNLI